MTLVSQRVAPMILLVLPPGAPLDSHSEYQGKKKNKKTLGASSRDRGKEGILKHVTTEHSVLLNRPVLRRN